MQFKQTVTFRRAFCIEAKDAAEANNKLESLLDEIEFESDVSTDMWYPFEDKEDED